jgi:hypothetical protein
VSIKTISLFLGATGSVIGLSTVAIPVLRSDPPPWASVNHLSAEHDGLKRVITEAKNELRSDLAFNRMFSLRIAQCQAVRAGNPELAQSIAQQIAETGRIYMSLTGLDINLPPCADL